MYRGDPMKFKKKLNISSLGAAICNVALFKTMKQREFKDEIFISYSQEGVILEAINQEEWEKANGHVEAFLNHKKISLLAFGFEKEAYEELIIKGLKDYTRRLKDRGEECPYINIIHYQKLRKSCEYMDKERYLQPLKDWQRKNKKNPNFAFLIVEPIAQFDEVKKNLLEYLLKKDLQLQQQSMSCLYFLLLFFNSSIKEELRDNLQKTYLEITPEYNKNYLPSQKQPEVTIKVTNYTRLKLDDLDYQIISNNKHLSRLGLEFIPAKEIEAQIKKAKNLLPSTVTNLKKEAVSSTLPFQQMHQQLVKQHGEGYCVIPFKKNEKDKYQAVINKFVNASNSRNVEELHQQIKKCIICSEEDIQILNEIGAEGRQQRGYRLLKACINDCPFLIHEYSCLPLSEIQTFLLYIEQLKSYYCSYLVRFYGICVRQSHDPSKGHIPAELSLQQKIQGYSYQLIFDYHHRTLAQMLHNDMILDNFQIGQITLEIAYLVYFLQHHEQPRALGSLRVQELFWPLKIILPYLKYSEQPINKQSAQRESGCFSCVGEGFEGDVKLAGQLMGYLLTWGEEADLDDLDDHFSDILRSMVRKSKYDRLSLDKCISGLEELLQIK